MTKNRHKVCRLRTWITRGTFRFENLTFDYLVNAERSARCLGYMLGIQVYRRSPNQYKKSINIKRGKYSNCSTYHSIQT